MLTSKRSDQSWMNVKEAAAYLGISRQTLYKLMELGKLRYYEIEGVQRKMLKRQDLDALFKVVNPKA